MYFGLTSLLVSLVALVHAQSGAYQQCGGNGWSGATTCVSGYTCTKLNDWYSQCVPGSPASTTSPPSTISSTPLPTTSSTPATPAPSSTVTASPPQMTGKQIRVDQTPAYHLYLQNIGGAPVLGPESSSGYFDIGKTIALNNADGTKLYLDIDTSVTTAWKPVRFDTAPTTNTWGLSGDTIIYGNQQNFVVCPISGSSNYNLYLSTSNDVPSGCTNYITIHLPCLC